MGIEGEDRVDSAPSADRPRVRMYVDMKLSQQGSKGLPCGTSPDSPRQDAVPNYSAASRTQEGTSNSSYVDGKRDAVSNSASINGKGVGVSNDTSINGNQNAVSNSSALEANGNISQPSPKQASPGATTPASSTRVTLGAPSPSPSPRGATRVYLGAQDGDAKWHGGGPSNAVTVSVAPGKEFGTPEASTPCGRLLDELIDPGVGGGTGADYGEEPQIMGPAGESLHLSHIHCTFLDDLLDGINRGGASSQDTQGTIPQGTSPQETLNTTPPQDKLTRKIQETLSQEHKDIQALQNTPRTFSQDASATKDKVTKQMPNQNQETSTNSLSETHNDHKATSTHHNEQQHLPQSSPKPNTGLQQAHKPSINPQLNEQGHTPSINPQVDEQKQPYLQQSSPTHIDNTSQQQIHHLQLQEPTGPPRDVQLQEPTPQDEQLQDTLSPQSDQAEELVRGLDPVSSPLVHDPLMQGATSSLNHQVAQNHGSTKILAHQGSAKATPILYGHSAIQQEQKDNSPTKSKSAVEQTRKKDSPSRSKLTPVLSGDSVTYFAQPPDNSLSTSKRIRQVLSQEPRVKPPISIKPTQQQSFKANTGKQELKTHTPKQTQTVDTFKQAQSRDLTTRPTQEVNSQNPCQPTQEVGLHTTKREDVQEEEQDGTWSQTTSGKGRREEVEDPTPYVGVVEEAPPEPPPPGQVEALESPQEGRERVDDGRTVRSLTQRDDVAEGVDEHTTHNHRVEGVGQERNSNPASTRPSALDITGWGSDPSPKTTTAPLGTNYERDSNLGSSPSPLEIPDRERDPNSISNSSPSSLETPDREREQNSYATSPVPLETESDDDDDDEGLGLAAAVSKVIRRSMRKMKRLRLSGRGSKNKKPQSTPDRSQDTEEEDLSEETQGRRSGLPPAPPLGYSTVRSPAAASIIVSSLMAALSPPPRETLSPPQASGDEGGEEEREGKRRRGSRPSSESRPLSGPFPPNSRQASDSFSPNSRPVSSNTRPVSYPSNPPTSLEVEVGGYLPNSNMDDSPGGSSWGATFIPRPSFSPQSLGPITPPNSATSSSNAANGSSRASNSLSGAGHSPSHGPNSLNNTGHSPSRNSNNGANSLPRAPNSLSNAPNSLNSVENSPTHGPNSLSNGSSTPHHTVNIPNISINTSSQNTNPTHSPNSQTQASDSPNRTSSSPNTPNHTLNSQDNSDSSNHTLSSLNHSRQTGPSISSENGGGRLEDGSEDTGRRRGRSGSRERDRRQQRGRQRERSESLPPTTTTIENGNNTTSRESSATPTSRDNEDRSSTDREINNGSRRNSNSTNNNRRRRGRSRSGSARNSPRPHVGVGGVGRSGVGGGTWAHPHSGLMASLAVTLTTFNISRFAVLGARFGWPFVVQWCVVSAVLGLPLMTFHVTLGQYLGAGVVDMWVLSPVFQGVGYSIMLAEVLLGVYCCVPIAWLFIFFRDSFITHNNMFRWTDCRLMNCSIYNNFSTIVIEGVPKYFNQQVLQRGEGAGTGSWLQELGTLKFDMAFNIALIWIITLLALSRGNQWYSKVSYVAVLVPLLCYLVVCLYLAAGSKDELYINNVTNFSEFFMNSRSWMAASREVFLVWGLHSAVLQQMAAHNKRGHALYRDTTVLWVVTSLALVLAAVTGSSCVAGLNRRNLVYKPSSFETSESAQFLSEAEEGGMFELEETIMKHLRLGPIPPRSRAEYRHHDNFYAGIRIRPIPLPPTFRKLVDDDDDESGYQSLRIATELFPALLAVNGAQKISPFWSSLFYLSLLLFGIAQQLAVWRTVIEAVISLWRERLQGWETFITFLCCLFGFSAALPMATGAGIHILYFLDYAVSCGWWLMIIQLVQIFALLFVRGKPYSGQDIVSELLGREGGCGWLWLGPLTSFSWNIMVPVGLLVLSISSFKSGHYREVFTWGGEGGYWSVWACQLAAALQLFPILLVPLVGLVQTCRYIASSDDDLFERIQRLYRPSLRSPYSHGRHAFLSTSESDLRDGVGGEEGEETGGDSNRLPLPYSDPPPKYTPPPSYSTATGARLAKLLNQGVRQSMRRLRASFRGTTNTTTPANTTDNETGVQTGGNGNSNNNNQSREGGGGVVSGSRPYIPPPDYVTVTECNNSDPPQYATLDPLRRQRALAVLSGIKIGDQGEREGEATTSGIQRNDSTRASSFSRSLASGVRRSARRLAATLGVGTGAEDGAALVVSEASTTGGPQSSDGPQPYVYTNIELVSHSYA